MPAVYYDDYVPYWFDAHNYIEVSQYSNWNEVSKIVSDYYVPLSLDKEQAEYILSNYPEITADSTKEDTIEILLDAVQEDIRYMGIEIGRGSYIPTEPYDVYTRKFGDCKDKSLLLCELLNYKGVESYPVLVYNSAGRDLINVLPSPYQFNHVIVKIIVDDEIYWFDPTNTFQEGSLENLSQADYGYGLVISEKTEDLERIDSGFTDINTIINEAFTLPLEITDTGNYTIESIYLNEDADYMRSYLSNSPPATIAEEFVDYLEFYYEGLTVEKDFEFTDDIVENKITLLEYYNIPEIWKYYSDQNHYQFTYSPFEIYNYTEELSELNRTMPYSLRHPVKVEQNVTINLPETWDIDNSSDAYNTKHFSFLQDINYSKNVLELSYTYESFEDSVPSDEIEEYNDVMVEIGQSIDYAIYWNPEEETDLSNRTDSENIRLVLIPLAVIVYIIIRFIRRKKPLIKFIDSRRLQSL